MLIEQTFVVQAPHQTLWHFLLDIERMSVCMPGVEKVAALDAETYLGTLTVKVGPIAARFSGKVRLIEVDPPRRLVAKAEATDARSASLVSATLTSTLTPVAEDRTEVAYQIDFSIRGALGRFGQGVMREVAKRMTTEFARCVEARLHASAGLPGAEAIQRQHPE